MDSFFLCVWPIDLYSSMVWPFLAFCLSLSLTLSLSFMTRNSAYTRAQKNRSEAKWWSLDLYHRKTSINLCFQVRLGDEMIILERERENASFLSLCDAVTQESNLHYECIITWERERKGKKMWIFILWHILKSAWDKVNFFPVFFMQNGNQT